jgi:hypothetical protein
LKYSIQVDCSKVNCGLDPVFCQRGYGFGRDIAQQIGAEEAPPTRCGSVGGAIAAQFTNVVVACDFDVAFVTSFQFVSLAVFGTHEACHGPAGFLCFLECRRDSAGVFVGLDQIVVYSPGV